MDSGVMSQLGIVTEAERLLGSDCYLAVLGRNVNMQLLSYESRVNPEN